MGKLNVEIIYKMLEDIHKNINELEEIIKIPYSELSTIEKFGIRYIVMSLVESSSGICMHILNNIFNVYPKGYPTCFVLLAEKNVISQELGIALANAARLRNILVHRYWEVDDEQVYQSAKEGIKDFKRFAETIYEVTKQWSK